LVFCFKFEKRGIGMAEVSNGSTMLSQEEIDKLIKKLEEEKENNA
jgi:phosphosulfolactate synthase (CoM biosynthesis protein A)